jgi:predicted transcriptional regulator
MGKVAEAVPITEATRRSITIPSELAAAIDTIAEQRRVTSNRVILDFIHEGIISYQNRRTAFLKLTERFQNSTNPAETERLREELMRMTFGS